MTKKVVTFGEIMLRLSTPNFRRFIQADSFDVVYGGGEANVAASLAQFGVESYFVSKLPDNPIGQAALNHLRRYGVRTDFLARGGDRLGIYFLETGVSQRPSVVVYDRAGSSLAEADKRDFDWDRIFSGTNWFHFTGITPALSKQAAQNTMEACCAAKANNATVSCDLNYRKKLWSEAEAREVMEQLMPYVDVVIANEEDAERVFGIVPKYGNVLSGDLDESSYRQVAHQLLDKFELKYTAITLRESFSASENGWSGMLYDGNEYYHSQKYRINLVDRVGGGDSFGAGLIYGFLQKWGLQECIEFAAAASCFKQTIPGDINLSGVEEIKRLAMGDASGRVQR